MTIIERVVSWCCRYSVPAVVLGLLLAAGAGWYTATHFAMNTDSEKLISANVPWRQREIKFDKLFPQQTGLILVVIDGATPELAEDGAARLSARLSDDPALFPAVRRPDYCLGRKSIFPSSVRSNPSPCRASRKSRARICTATG